LKPRLKLSRKSKSLIPRSKKLDNINQTLILRSARRHILRKRLRRNSRPPRKSSKSLKRTSRLMSLNSRTPRLRVRRPSSKRRSRPPRRRRKLLPLQLRPLRRLLPLLPRNSPISPVARLSRKRKSPLRALRKRFRPSPPRLLLPSPSSHWSSKKSQLPPLKVQLVLPPLPPLPPPHPALLPLPTQVSLLE